MNKVFKNKQFTHRLRWVLTLFVLLTMNLQAQTNPKLSFEADEGSWISLDVHPKGKHIAFELLGDIYQLPLTGGTAKPLLQGSDFASQPRYSPDGNTLVFVSDRNGEDNLWLAKADGSQPRQLSFRKDGELISPSWSRDGQTLYVSQLASRRSMSANVELWAYPLDGGQPSKIDTPNLGRGTMLVSAFASGAYGPQASAHGDALYFTAAITRQHRPSAAPKAKLMTIDLAGGAIRTISERSEPTFRPQLSNDGQWLAFGAVHSGKTGLRLRNLNTGEERWLLQDIGFNALESWASRDMLPGFAFTPSNEALILAYQGKIRRVNLVDGKSTIIPFLAKVNKVLEPRVSTSIKLEQGPVTASIAKGATISPDGTQFAFSVFGRLYRMALSDRNPHKLSSDTRFGEFHPSWSPDGKWLAYVSWNAIEGGALWKIPSDGSGPAIKLSADEAYYRNPVWSPDGTSLLAIQAPRQLRLENSLGALAKAEQIVQINHKGSPSIALAAAAGASSLQFGRSGKKIYSYSPRSGLSSRSLDGGGQHTHLRVLGQPSPTTSPAMAGDIQISPDERHALAGVAGQLYLIDLSKLNPEQPVVNVYTPSEAYTKLTSLGADHFSWADAQTIGWSAGNTLYRRSINSDKVLEAEALVQRPRDIPSGKLMLRGARIITMQGDKVIENGDLLIDGNRIQAIGEHGTLAKPADAMVIDVSGKTIMPGIVDIHAHWNVKRSVLDLQDYNALANLAYGVTAIRDPQSTTDDIFVYGDAIATGELAGPRVFSTGRGIFFFNNFTSYEQVYSVLERYKNKYRTHLIKSYLPGSRQVRQWMVKACRELGLIVTSEGGSDAKMNLTFALDGFSGTEHAVPMLPHYEDIVQLFAQSGISYTPTLLVSFGGPFAADHFIAEGTGLKDKKLHRFMPSDLIQERVSKGRQVDPDRHIYPMLAKGADDILKAGGNIGLGGHGEMQGLQVHWEMWALAAGGMSNLNVLRVATLESAKAIGLDSELGSLKAGNLADLLILDKNPLEDIANTNTVGRVMVNGTLYDANTLAKQWPVKKPLAKLWWQSPVKPDAHTLIHTKKNP